MTIPQSECVYIQKGGIVSNIIWDSNKREYIINDEISDILFHYLKEPCYLEDGVTLRDIFNILKRNMLLAKLIINNWVEEIVNEGLSGKSEKDSEIDYLEIYRSIDVDQLFTINNCEFHGIGFPLEKEELCYQKGDIINYSLSMTNSKDIIDHKLKLNNNLKVYKGFDLIETYSSENTIYTVYDVLYWPIWELSFHGGPEKREEKKKEIIDIKNNYYNEKMDREIYEEEYARTR